MERRYQVFVSSTYLDLVEERSAVLKALLKEKYIPEGMELFPPTDDNSWELIKRRIKESDYYLVLVGKKYGTLFPNTFSPEPVTLGSEPISYTWLEYEYAQLIGKPTIALFLESSKQPDPGSETGWDERLKPFRSRVFGSGRNVYYWRDEASLVTGVTAGLRELIDKSPSQGWIRGPRIIKPSKRPFGVTLLGPLTGDEAPFGWSQARSVLAALMRILPECCGEPWESYEEFFEVKLVDTERARSRDHDDYTSLREDFAAAQRDSRAVFGPMDSSEVRALFYEPFGADSYRLNEAKVRDLKAYTILTTATTTEVRQARKFSDKLIQLSPNAKVYARHLVRFAAFCVVPPLERILVLHEEGREYGRSIAREVKNYAREHRLEFSVCSYEKPEKGLTLSEHAERVLEKICVDDNYNNNRTLLVVVETGDKLRAIVKAARNLSKCVLSTTTSLDDSVLQGGDLEGVLVISSFAPGMFSLNSRDFTDFIDRAETHWSDPLKMSGDICGPRAGTWNTINSVDAEVYDAAIHWFATSGLSGIEDLRPKPPGRLYVTNFFITGHGPSEENTAALYALRVQNAKLVPAVF